MERQISRDSSEISSCDQDYQTETNLNQYFRQDSEFRLSDHENHVPVSERLGHINSDNTPSTQVSERIQTSNASVQQTFSTAYESFRRCDTPCTIADSGVEDDELEHPCVQWEKKHKDTPQVNHDKNTCIQGVDENSRCASRNPDVYCEYVHVHSFGNYDQERRRNRGPEGSVNTFESMTDIQHRKSRILSDLEDSLGIASELRDQNQCLIDNVTENIRGMLNYHSEDEHDYVMISEKVSVLESQSEKYFNSPSDFRTHEQETSKPKLRFPSTLFRRRIKAGRFPYEEYSVVSEFHCSRRRISGIVTLNGSVFTAIFGTTEIRVFDYHGNAIDTIDVKAEVDDITLSDDNKLYISCSSQKMIQVLNAELEIRVFVKTPLHIRGLTIDPNDNSVIACLTSTQDPRYSSFGGISKENCLMRFPTYPRQPKGRRINRYNCFSHPVRVSINKERQLLVSDEGLNSVLVLNTEGLVCSMIEYQTTAPFQLLERHVIMCTMNNNVIVAQGGFENIRVLRLDGNPIITRTAMHIKELEIQSVRAGTIDENGVVIIGTETGMIKIFKLMNIQ